MARARGELAKLRQRQAHYTYTDWRRLRDESAYWIGTVSHMSPGGINWFERAVWDAVVDSVRRRYPQTLRDVWWKYTDDADALDDLIEDTLRDVLAEERHALPLRDLHARQRARGLDVNPLRFKTVSA